jgi:hypothetical protein
MAWSIGSAIAIPDPNYALVPEAASRDVAAMTAPAERLVPRSFALLTDAPDKLRQRMLPMSTADTAGNGPLAVELATRSLLSVHAAKVGLLVLSSTSKKGLRFVTSISDLADRINPGSKKVTRPMHLRTADGLIELAHLRVEFDDGRWFRLFDLVVPPLHLAEADAATYAKVLREPFGIGPTGSFMERATGGSFMVNLKGLLALPNQQDALVRHYVRACYDWNRAFLDGHGGFNPQRVREWDVLAWGAEVNDLPQRVVEYVAASPARKRELKRRRAPDTSRACKDVLEHLDHLHQLGLMRLERGARGETFRIMPPAEYVGLRQDLHADSTAKAQRKPKGRPKGKGGAGKT